MADTDTNPEIDALKESVAKLEANNKRLTDELKQARKNAEITPEQLTAAEEARDKAQAEVATLQKELSTVKKAADSAQKALEAESSFTQKLLVENGLLETLAKNGVTDPAYQKAAVAMLKSGVQIVVDGENRVAKVGDKLLADHVKEWAASDEGKRFVVAPNNSGGGSQGPGGAKKVDLSTLPPAQRLAAAREAQQT